MGANGDCAYPRSSELGFSGRFVLVVSRVQRRQSLFIRLADLLELLNMFMRRLQIDLGHLQLGTSGNPSERGCVQNERTANIPKLRHLSL